MNRKLKTFALIGAAATLALSGYAASSSVGAESFASLFADSSDSGNKDASTDGYYIASDNVLHITTSDGWNSVAQIYAEGGGAGFDDATSISLDADISFSQGNISFPLSISLDGNGYTVSKNTTPLFSQIEEGATLSNLAIDNGTKTYTNINIGYTNFGVLTEANFGTIDNCSVIGTAEIHLQTLIGSAAESVSFYVGGLVGFNVGTISNTYSNVQLILNESSSDYGTNTAVPQALYISDFVGGNLGGTISNCFVDFATPNGSDMSSDMIHESQYASSISLAIGESASVSATIPIEIALSIAKNDVSGGGSVSNVYCPKGFFASSDGEKADFQYERFIPTIEIQQSGKTVSEFSLSMTDSDYLTMMPDYFPSASQIPFSPASDWMFTHTWYEKDTASYNANTISYRAPMPRMGRSLYLGRMEVAADGSVSVISRLQWNHLSDAIELCGAKTISLEADLEADNDPTFPVRNFNDGCTLNGNGNTIYIGAYNANNPTAPFDVIGKGATVSNLGVAYSYSIPNLYYPTFGLLARVNSGTISSCSVSGIVENTFNSMLGDYSSYSNGVEVSLGGVVGVNEGTIKELYANVQNVVETTSGLSVCPSAFNIGGIAGSNTGEITDVMLDNVTMENDATVLYYFPVSLNDFTLAFSGISSAQTVEFNAGQSVGKNTGTLSNVYCAKGFYTEQNYFSSTYDTAISAKSLISQSNSDGGVISETLVTIFDDKASMTELSRKWPVSADLNNLFTTPANWRFDRSSELKSTDINRRSPVPKMGKESSTETYDVTLEDGVAKVPNEATWSQLILAIADGLDGLTDIEITGDFSLRSQETLDVLDVPLYGNAHTLYSATSSLVDSISQNGAIQNLAIVSGNLQVSQPQFGGLARVNCGSIDGVHFSANLSLDLANIVTDPNIAIGGLVAQNDGYITSTNVSTAISDATDETTIPFSGDLHSFYVSNAVAVNNATMSDVYIGDADNSRYDEIMSFPSERKVEFSAVDDAASFEALLGPVAAKNNGTLSHIVAPNGMTDNVKEWKLLISFSRGTDDYSPEITSLIDSETTNDQTVLSADTYVTEWATDESLALFQDPSRWTFNVPLERETGSNTFVRFPVPNMMSRSVSIKVDEETKKVSAVAGDSSSFMGVFDLLGDSKTHFFQSADVDIPQNIVYNELAEIDGSLTDATIGNVLEKLPTISNYAGVMNGATIENLAIQSDGIFNNISEESQVNDLVFNNAIFYVDPTDPVHRRDETEPAIYISLIAKTNMGEVNNAGFFGSVIMDEDKYAATGDTTIYFSLVGEHDGEALTGFVFLDECAVLTTDKRLIAFKQNLCTGEYKRKTNVKVAVRNNNDAGNKLLPLVDFSDARFDEYEVTFSDEEFESGLVACWLNYAGQGFTGIYTGKWKQGKRVPVSCSDKSEALYPVKFQVEGENCISSIPQFANGGSEITIKYTQRPLRITLDGTPVAIGDDKSTTLIYEGDKTLKVYFDATSIDDVEANDEFSVSVDGSTVTFSGVDGKVKVAFDLAGRLVSETNAESMTLNNGVYVVRCGAKSVRVVVK